MQTNQITLSSNTLVLTLPHELRRRILSAVVVAAVFAGITRAAVVPPDALVDGRSYREWTASWWHWAFEIPDDGHHPLKDRTGGDALRNQSGRVWFLPWFLGPVNTSSIIVRRITVPDDKVLFVAIHGSDCSTIESPPSYCSEEGECGSCAASFIATNVSCAIDGVSVANLDAFTITSSPFEFTLPAENIAGVPGGGGPVWGVGYGTHVMIEGLSPGAHTVRFHARYQLVAWDITYQITVYARPALTVRPMPGNNLELSWPVTSGFSLQEAESLDTGATWVAAPVISMSIADGTQFATVTNDFGSRFFRLHKP